MKEVKFFSTIMAIFGILIAWLFQSRGLALEADCSFFIAGIFGFVALVTITVDAVRSWRAKRRVMQKH